jgi:hypothetical protein
LKNISASSDAIGRLLALEDFTDADIAALEQTTAPESSKALDDELV